MAERLTTIRRAAPGDAAALAELGVRTFRDAFESDNKPEDIVRFCDAVEELTGQHRAAVAG